MASLANTYKRWKNFDLWVKSLRVDGNDISAADIAQLDGLTAGTAAASKALVVGTLKQIDTLANAAPVLGVSATPGAATQSIRKIVKKTGIADNTATGLLTVTVPNANHAAALHLIILATCGVGTDAFESSRVATGTVVLARTTGANVVAAVSTIAQAQIATVSGGGTITLAYGVSSITGAVGAVNTFDVQVTIVMTGTITSHQAVVVAELVNAEASGVTFAAAA